MVEQVVSVRVEQIIKHIGTEPAKKKLEEYGIAVQGVSSIENERTITQKRMVAGEQEIQRTTTGTIRAYDEAHDSTYKIVTVEGKAAETAMKYKTEREKQSMAEKLAYLERRKMTHAYVEASRDQGAAEDFLRRKTHLLNMNVLGLNMSMLGLWWSLSALPFVTKEQGAAIRGLVAPIQAVLTATNAVLSVYGMWKTATTIITERLRAKKDALVLTDTAIVKFSGRMRTIIPLVLSGALAFGAYATYLGVQTAAAKIADLQEQRRMATTEAQRKQIDAQIEATRKQAAMYKAASIIMASASVATAIATVLKGAAIASLPYGPLYPIIFPIMAAALMAAILAFWGPYAMERGGITKREGLFYLHPGEAVIPLERHPSPFGNIINITIVTNNADVMGRQVEKTIRRQLGG